LIAEDTLYFKVDDVTRPGYVARALGPFRPYGEGGEVMQYYQVPEEILEDVEALRSWVTEAVAVAQRAKRRRPHGRRPKK
jgi:DNA transformation protein